MRGTLRRKTADSWQVRIFRGRDEHGRQLFDYHTIHAATKREAEAARTALLHALDTGTYAEPSAITVAEYLESWLADYAAHNVSPYSFDRYAGIVRNHLTPALGAVRLNQLTPVRIERYYAAALEHGRLRPLIPKKTPNTGAETAPGLALEPILRLNPQTVLKHHRVLRTALKRAVRLGLLVANPCDRVDPPKAARAEMKALDELDTERLLSAARDAEPLSLYAAVLLAANTGLRRGEVLGLRWSDVDFDAGALHVSRSLQRSSAGIAFKEPKTATGNRMLILDTETLSELKAYRARQNVRRLGFGAAWQNDDLVCPGRFGEPWHPNACSRDFRRLREQHGFKVRFHDLRHSHASQLIRAGAPAKVVQERLGHASAGFTLTVYGHLLPGMQAEAVSRLSEARSEARAKLAAEG